MNRRDAIRQGTLFATAAALWTTLPRPTWAALPAVPGWSEADETLLNTIGDAILPATPGSPGAGAVGIGRFIVMMTRDCFAPEAADTVRAGLRDMEARSRTQFGRTVGDLRPDEREAFLTAYEKSAAAATKAGALNPFRHIKELTLLGYFTSEPGATQALRYDPVPGTYRGSVPLADGDRSWAM
jgi:hypothetical protein